MHDSHHMLVQERARSEGIHGICYLYRGNCSFGCPVFFSKASFKPLRLIGRIAVRFVVGALFLFCVNLFGESVGIHVPINIVTTGERIIGGSRCSSFYCH